jgi:hypothetical protein
MDFRQLDRGELVAILGGVILGVSLFLGWPWPGAPSGEISVDYGWWIAVTGGLLILIGSVWRARESAAARKPPGLP